MIQIGNKIIFSLGWDKEYSPCFFFFTIFNWDEDEEEEWFSFFWIQVAKFAIGLQYLKDR